MAVLGFGTRSRRWARLALSHWCVCSLWDPQSILSDWGSKHLGRRYHLPSPPLVPRAPSPPPLFSHVPGTRPNYAWITVTAPAGPSDPAPHVHPADSCPMHLAKCPLSSAASPFSKGPTGSVSY